MNRPTKENNYIGYFSERLYIQFVDDAENDMLYGELVCEPENDAEQDAYEHIHQCIYVRTRLCGTAEESTHYVVDNLSEYRILRKEFMSICKKYGYDKMFK